MDATPEATAWTAVMPADDLPEGKPTRATLLDEDLLLYRRGGAVFAVGNRCTHAGAPLHRGNVKSLGSFDVVTCPAHGSMFRLDDGRVVRGPAMHPVAAYEARVSDGIVEVRPPA